jgi:hypothetical protein
MLGLNCMDWNWEVRPTHGTLDRVALYMDHLLTTPHMNYSTHQRFQTHRTLFHTTSAYKNV